jgi:hypothetical protein
MSTARPIEWYDRCPVAVIAPGRNPEFIVIPGNWARRIAICRWYPIPVPAPAAPPISPSTEDRATPIADRNASAASFRPHADAGPVVAPRIAT